MDGVHMHTCVSPIRLPLSVALLSHAWQVGMELVLRILHRRSINCVGREGVKRNGSSSKDS